MPFVSIDVDIDEEIVLQYLSGCSDEERRNIINHALQISDGKVDLEDLAEALSWFRRGQRAEALIHLERALPRDFHGYLTEN